MVQYTEVNYADQPVGPIIQQRGFQEYTGSLTISRKIGLRLSGRAAISVQSLRTGGTGTTSNNLGSDVSLNYRVSPRLNVAVGYALSNEPSPTVIANYVRSENLRLNGDYRLNQRIGLHLGVAKSRTDYRGGAVFVPLQIHQSEDTTFSGGASVKIGRKISVNFEVAHTDRNADISQFDYKSDRVSLGISGTF